MNGRILLAATALIAVFASGAAKADGDVAKGEKVFRKCKVCHSIGPGAENKVGPVLTGVVGRPAGSVADFSYSDAMKTKAAEGLVWDAKTLSEFLTKPKDFVPGTKMTFAGLRKEADRDDLIAYLGTFK